MTTSEQQLDVDDQLTRDRLRSIEDAREDVRKARLEATRSNSGRALLQYRVAVENYLTELEPYSRVSDEAQVYWTGDDEPLLGTIRVDPPPLTDDAWWDDYWPSVNDRPLIGQAPKWVTDARKVRQKTNYRALEEQGGQVDVLDGLHDILTAPQSHSMTFTLTVRKRHQDAAVRREVVQPIPREVLDTAYELANDFRQLIGLDIEVAEKDHHGKT